MSKTEKIEDALNAMESQLKLYGVKPRTIIFGDGFIDALAKERDYDPETTAVLLISRFPDGYVGRAYDHLRRLSAEFAEHEGVVTLGVAPAKGVSVEFEFSVEQHAKLLRMLVADDSRTIKALRPDNTWRDHFRSERPYGKKSRRKR